MPSLTPKGDIKLKARVPEASMQFSSHKEKKDGAGGGPIKRPKLWSNSGGSLSDGGEGSAEGKQIEGYYMFPP